MSLARILKREKDHESGVVSLKYYLEKEVVKPQPVFSYKNVKKSYDKFGEALESDAEENFREAMMKAFMDLYRTIMAPPERAKGVFHASSLKDDCPRKLYYEISGVMPSNKKAPTPAKLQMIFDIGTFIHVYIQDLCDRAGILEASEVAVEDIKLKISSRADGIIRLMEKRMLLEIKSINSRGFSALTKPLEHHIHQASFYAKRLGLQHVVILYYCKDTSEMKEFFFVPDEKSIKEAEDKIHDILKACKDEEVPERECSNEYTKQAIECVYCKHCFAK